MRKKCIGGGITSDHKLRKAKDTFFIPVRILRDKFKGKYLDGMNFLYKKVILTVKTHILFAKEKEYFSHTDIGYPFVSWYNSEESHSEQFCFISGLLFSCVPSTALILLVQVQSRVFTAKCSEPQVGTSNGMDGGSGVAKSLSLRTET